MAHKSFNLYLQNTKSFNLYIFGYNLLRVILGTLDTDTLGTMDVKNLIEMDINS
jgi:hypothetical protein